VASAPLTIVIGAGISGLTCAYALKKSGQNVMLLETSARPGGLIQSVAENGFFFELGPQSFSGTETVLKLCDELGLSPQLIEAPHAAPRYVLVDGKLVQVPLSPGAFLFSPLFTWRTKFSIVSEVFRTSKPTDSEESVASFVRAKFTPELLDRLVGPFISGIYAGDPEQLSLRAAFPKIYEADCVAGSVIRGSLRMAKSKATSQHGRRPGLYTFREGNEALVRALASYLGTSLRCEVIVGREIKRGEGRFHLSIKGPAETIDLPCEKLVLATPTQVSSEFLRSLAPSATSELSDITYAPLAVVSHGYRTDQLSSELRGFGFLIPRSSKIRTLGTVWNSSLFPDRAPERHVLMTSFIGGATDSSLLSLSTEEISETVCREMAGILRISGKPAIARVTEYRAAIPQYNLGHTSRLRIIKEAVSQVPGLWLIGNYSNGPAIGACIEQSLAVAEEIRIG
jgi:protoporphyrinogen/coproporphyrinogen III oxidase